MNRDLRELFIYYFFNFSRCVAQGPISQGEVSTSGNDSATGMQCTCTSLVFLCITTSSTLTNPSPSDVDRIVLDGSELYTTTISKCFAGSKRYLLIAELPVETVLHGKRYTLDRVDAISGLVSRLKSVAESMTFSLQDALQKTFDLSNACFLTIGIGASGGYTMAIRKCANDKYWFFDSHSRSEKVTRSVTGKAVIMEAISLIVLEKFILELANSISANCDGMQFELVPVNCVCSDVCSVAIEVPQFPDRDKAVDSTVNLPMQTLTDTQHNSNNAKSSTTDLLRQENMTKYIQYVSKEKGERPRIICSLCAKYPEVVRRFYTKGPLPLICTTGAEARSYTIDNHFQSEHHRQCVATAKLNVMSHHEKLMTVPVLKQISKQNVELANKIGGLMISVFNDAKSLSSSAYSWPSRVVASHIASQYNCNDPFVPHEPSSFDLQYISPTAHRELLHTIVQSHLPEFRRHISSSLALSFRCDASMDRTQTDNQFLLAKIVDQSGEERTLFVGLGEVNEPGTDGHLKALKAGANATVGFDTVLKK